MNRITKAKAVMAGATTLAGTFGTAMTDGHLTIAEAVAVACAVVFSAAAVYATPNARET